jgi:hypothetical protein
MGESGTLIAAKEVAWHPTEWNAVVYPRGEREGTRGTVDSNSARRSCSKLDAERYPSWSFCQN